MKEEKKYKKRPIDEIATKITVNRNDSNLLLEWARIASAEEQKAIPTREIVRRLIEDWRSKNVGSYAPRIRGTGE